MKSLNSNLFGFPLEVRPSALFILGFIVLMSGSFGGGRVGIAVSIMLGVVFFVSIMIHELGHAIAAQFFGLGPIRLVIHGFGGLTSFGAPPSHKQGVLVSLAGPAAGLILALLSWFWATNFLTTGSHYLWVYTLSMLIQINIFWSIFNLLPIFPLDGGQVMWHGLSMGLPSAVARRRTRQVSIALSTIIGIYALLNGQIFIALVCLFTYSQNSQVRG